jgi:hypothetical protein
MRARVVAIVVGVAAVTAVIVAGCAPDECNGSGTCTCNGLGDCSKYCAGTGCNFDCAGAGRCDFDCPHGSCASQKGNLSCEVGDCWTRGGTITYCPTGLVTELLPDGSQDLVACPPANGAWNCTTGDTCRCEGPGACAVTCTGGGCNFECSSDYTCAFACPGGGCSATTAGDGSCTLAQTSDAGVDGTERCTQ